MVFENHIESLIQYCERSELRLQKLIKMQKTGTIWRVFENLKLAVKQCYQTGYFQKRQKLVENAKINTIQMRLFGCFQAM